MPCSHHPSQPQTQFSPQHWPPSTKYTANTACSLQNSTPFFILKPIFFFFAPALIRARQPNLGSGGRGRPPISFGTSLERKRQKKKPTHPRLRQRTHSHHSSKKTTAKFHPGNALRHRSIIGPCQAPRRNADFDSVPSPPFLNWKSLDITRPVVGCPSLTPNKLSIYARFVNVVHS